MILRLTNVVTISGTPTAAGSFTYTVTLTDGMYQYGNHQYHLCNYGSNGSNGHGVTGRCDRDMAYQCCHYQWHTDSRRIIYLYSHSDRRLWSSNNDRNNHCHS